MSHKDNLLTVLRHPFVPPENNGQERGAKARVRKRDISFGPRSEQGLQAWDTMQSTVGTLRKLGTAGRDHWGSHHVTVVIGKPFKAGVIGGVELKGTTPTSQEWYATPINSTTGASDSAGDITVNDSLAAVGKTIGKGVGVPESELGTSIMMGKVISAALA